VTIQQALEIGWGHHRAGQLAEAESIYRQILALQPQHADALHLAGVVAYQTGRHDAAVELIRAAISLAPLRADCWNNLGHALKDQGRFDEAIAAYREAIRLQPDFAMAHNNLGNVLAARGKIDEAIASYRRALQLDPAFAEAHDNLGSALSMQGAIDEAIASHRRALQLKPDLAVAHNNLGNALKNRGQLDDAIAAYRRAAELKPDYAEPCNNMGSALQAQDRLDEAVTAYRRAIDLAPNFAMAWNNFGGALTAQGRSEEAVAACRRAIEIEPPCAEAHSNLGAALQAQGRLDEAVVSYRRAMELAPGSSSIHSNLLAVLHYCPAITLPELFEQHREFDRRHCAPLRESWHPHENGREPERMLRLGFVSPHFARHPVGRFIIRALEKLDRSQVRIVAYSDSRATDEMTVRIRAATSEWHEVAAISDEQLARKIREDRIDILFDLAGQTGGNRLPVFARKPAPIQITWLDYVGTTGLSAIDYILADPRQIPPGAERWFHEKVLRMPDDYICFDPPGDAPPVRPLPAIANGHVTFGSFNIVPKITPGVVSCWARVLHRVPQSRLMLKSRGWGDPATRSRFRQMFAALGIAEDRLEVHGWSPPAEVLACYNEVDIALDTFPYNGGLTTCEAIWMGVPVVTCPGETFASRHGLAHLSAAGMTETVARDLDHYVELAVGLASDLPGLGALRAGLRERVAASALCDGPRFAGHLMTLLRGVWRQWVGQRANA